MSLLDHLEKLRHFVGVAHAGSIRAYATSRRISQPAISKAIQVLETELEVSLLARGRDGVALTPAGGELLTFAEDMLARATAADTRIRGRGDLQLDGRFTLGTYESIAVYFLPKLVAHLERVQRRLHVDFVTAPSARLVQLLLSGAADFIISIDPPNKRAMARHVLYEDRYSLYKHASIPARDVPPRVFTLPSATDQRGKPLRAYLEENRLFGSVVACGDFESAKAFVEAALGWGLLPDRVAEPLVGAGKLARVFSMPKLQSIGTHAVVFSCLKHRQADRSIGWIRDQICLMLRSPI